MKYKRLSSEELQHLEKDFIGFLAHAQITGLDWEKMKKEEIEKANELIDVFSDVVYDKVLRKIKYLEYRDAKTLNLFYCMEDKIILIGLRVKENSPLDFTSEDVLKQWNESNAASVNILKTEKSYTKEREVEILEMLESGCLITDDHLFNTLSKLV